MRCAGLILDDSPHFLDHVAPFCALGGYPLLICEPELADFATKFYPDLDVRYVPFQELEAPKWTISCYSKSFLAANFPWKETKTLWLPHGNSDKGWHAPIFESLECDVAFVYGQRMIDFMAEKGAFPKTIRVGNFRYEYFRKHKLRETALEKKIFLYAPTWDDYEDGNSFWKAFPTLAKQLPEDCHLWIKMHPNTMSRFGHKIEILIGKYERDNILFLPNEPPIYPLLAKCTAYIGDMSSIGYDFLTFNRPMYFLNAKKFLPLHQCGKSIEAEAFDFVLDHSFLDQQRKLYEYTFDAKPKWKEELDALCSL